MEDEDYSPSAPLQDLGHTCQAPMYACPRGKGAKVSTTQEKSNAPPPKASNAPMFHPKPCVPSCPPHLHDHSSTQVSSCQVQLYKPPCMRPSVSMLSRVQCRLPRCSMFLLQVGWPCKQANKLSMCAPHEKSHQVA
jgi:hypothetical protein